MTLADKIRQYVETNPGATNQQIAKALGITTPNAGGNTNYMAVRAAKPTLDRREVRRTISNKPVYGYWPIATKQEDVPEVKHPSPEKRVMKKPSSTLEQLVDQLASQLVMQVVSKVKVRLTSELEAMIPASLPTPPDLAPLIQRLSAPQDVHSEKIRLPRVGVVGLMPVQAGELTTEFSDALDLRFATADRTSDLAALKGCDVIFLHTRHMSHAADQYLRTFGVELRRVTGGVSKLKDELTAFFVKG